MSTALRTAVPTRASRVHALSTKHCHACSAPRPGVTTGYQRDSSSKRPRSSVPLAARGRHRPWKLPALWTLEERAHNALENERPVFHSSHRRLTYGHSISGSRLRTHSDSVLPIWMLSGPWALGASALGRTAERYCPAVTGVRRESITGTVGTARSSTISASVHPASAMRMRSLMRQSGSRTLHLVYWSQA